jgi:hypothetical protein
MNKTFKVNYLAKDFATIKNELKEYAKRYYANEFADLSEASINSFMIDMAAYVGDVLSYYTDYQANESFLSTAIETNNVLKLAKSMGYKQSQSTTTAGKVAMYMLIPSDGYNSPDYTSVPIIKKGTTLKSSDNTRTYLINEDIIIDENFIGSNYVVARTNDVGNPTYYAVKFYVPIISGEIIETTLQVEDFVKFNKLFLNDANAVEILSVQDSDGNVYYEVPNLSQNIIYQSVLNKDSSDSSVRYILKPISAERRFVFEVDNNLPTLTFGARQYKPDDDLTINPIAEPTKFILNRYNNDFLQDAYFDPNKLLNGDSFGIGPENTTLTISYRRNSNQINTAVSGEITTVNNFLYEFTKSVPSEIINTIVGSVQVINEEPIVGENLPLSVNEIKDLAGIIYQSQNRAVTAKDYEALSYMMPPKYGSLKRVKAERDPRSLKNNINLYVACSEINGSLASPNTKIKENLKTWLSSYKMITDTVDIIDAKIINLGIDYTILVDPNFNKLDVYNLVQQQLQFVFSFKPQIGESFRKLDIYREIQKIDGVLDVIDIKIRNITDAGYSATGFNIEENTTEDGNVILMPRNAIYEIKFPTVDIAGKAI